jgi:hypothetical protein
MARRVGVGGTLRGAQQHLRDYWGMDCWMGTRDLPKGNHKKKQPSFKDCHSIHAQLVKKPLQKNPAWSPKPFLPLPQSRSCLQGW